MTFTVAQLVDVLTLFFPGTYPARNALLAIGTLAAMVPLLEFHRLQRQRPRQPQRTAWYDSIYKAYEVLLRRSALPERSASTKQEDQGVMHALSNDLDALAELLELQRDLDTPLLPIPSTVICTTRRVCAVCPANGPHAPYVLYRHEEPQRVNIVLASFERRAAVHVAAYCKHCSAHYYADRITTRDPENPQKRVIRLEPDPSYIRISKPDKLWAHKGLMTVQSAAFRNFYCGWSSFSKFVKESALVAPTGTVLNERQSKRMFTEYFARRLLLAHDLLEDFRCPMNPDTDELITNVLSVVGEGQEHGPHALEHQCTECTHVKRRVAVRHDPDPNARYGVVGVDVRADAPVLENAALPPSQVEPEAPDLEGKDDEYLVNMVVIDGKVIQHWICAVTTCKRPLRNYKNGRFCAIHEEQLGDQCAIASCNLPVAEGSLVCSTESHANWYRHYRSRFGRLTYQGVRRVIRQQLENPPRGNEVQNRVRLPDVDGLAGNDVPHTLRPRSVHCIQTAQWACGYPIAWTKFFDSESLPQVYSFLTWIWPDPRTRPTFLTYDSACKLLRHIITSHMNEGWLEVTRFLVDAWHYINHVAGDDICSTWCNPAPMDGSQPDLVIEQEDANGNVHQTRAFNMETAEQFNSWLDRYKGLLEQMTASSHDFVMHVLFMLYAETVTERIRRREHPDSEDDDD